MSMSLTELGRQREWVWSSWVLSGSCCWHLSVQCNHCSLWILHQ